MLWIVIGMLCVLAGIVLVVTEAMWGLVFLLGGLGIMIFHYNAMMRAKGCDPNQGTINGLNGQGKQQSEEVEMPQPVIGEQPANIWDKMEQEKK